MDDNPVFTRLAENVSGSSYEEGTDGRIRIVWGLAMRCFFRIVITVAVCGPLFCQDRVPGWFSDAKGFCRELADRANGKGTPVPPAKPNSVRFTDYASRSVAPQRSQEAIIGKDEANNDEMFAQTVKLAASGGPDFAGRYCDC